MQFPTDFAVGMDLSEFLKLKKKKEKKSDDSDNDELKKDTSKAEWDPDCPFDVYPPVVSITINYLKDKNYIVNEIAKICIESNSIVNLFFF